MHVSIHTHLCIHASMHTDTHSYTLHICVHTHTHLFTHTYTHSSSAPSCPTAQLCAPHQDKGGRGPWGTQRLQQLQGPFQHKPRCDAGHKHAYGPWIHVYSFSRTHRQRCGYTDTMYISVCLHRCVSMHRRCTYIVCVRAYTLQQTWRHIHIFL